MHARSLGIDFLLRDGLVIDGAAEAQVVGRAPTEARIDYACVERALAVAGPEPDGQRARTLFVPGHGWLVTAPGVGGAVVSEDGRLASCAPAPGSRDWGALFTAQVVSLVATLRGQEVFHAAGIQIDGGAHLLCGPQGVGKSSLATQLVLSGAGLLADDVIAIDESLIAHPGPAVLHIREGERANVELPGDEALSWDGEMHGRRRLRVSGPSPEAVPVAGIHLLTRRPSGDPVAPLAAPEPVTLLGATFSVAVTTPRRLVRQLLLCDSLARRVPVTELRIVPGRGASELAAALLIHLRSPGPASA